MIAAFLQEPTEHRPRRIDYAGSLLLMLSLTALMLVLVQGGSLPPAALVGLGVICLAMLLALAVHESSTPEPMLPLDLWRQHRIIAVGSFGGAVISAVMTGVSAFLPTYVQGAMGRSALAGGLVLGAMSVTWAIASFLGGRLMVRTTYRLTAIVGTLALIAGSAVLITLTPARGTLWASSGSLLIGIGMGLCNTTFIVSIQAAVPWHQRGAATSSCMFLRFVGQSLGAAAFGAVLNLTLLHRAPEEADMVNQLLEPSQRDALPAAELARLIDVVAQGLHNTYLLAGVLSVAALGFALLLPARLSPAMQGRKT
jgi:MFS family permease